MIGYFRKELIWNPVELLKHRKNPIQVDLNLVEVLRHRKNLLQLDLKGY